ncbi:MAG: sulfatase family protein [Actinomycetota bacterium]
MPATRRLLTASTALAIAVGAALAQTTTPAAAVEHRPKPNIVLIVTDDQRWDTLSPECTPNIWNRLVVPGVSFQDAFVPNALCCPSRTSILTGRYSHSTGVWTNISPHGGFTAFRDDGDTLATDLQSAGYRTALIGKYLNEYMDDRPRYVPPGWDRWFAVDSSIYYDYVASSNGRIRHFGETPADYSTDVLASQAVSFIQKSEERGRRFFLYFAPTAPHVPAIPAPNDEGMFPVDDYTQPVSYAVSIADGPSYDLASKWSYQRIRRAATLHETQLESMYDVDRAVGSILDVVPTNTVVVYLSDNGMLWGEHRLIGKGVPYNESIRVPIVLTALDGRPLPSTDRIALNVDIRATLDGVAGLSPPTEGHDWFDPSWSRNAFVLEHLGGYGGSPDPPSYCGVRTRSWMYARYATGEQELYDEIADPLETTNVAAQHPDVVASLRARAKRLCDPPPPGYSWGAVPAPSPVSSPSGSPTVSPSPSS